MSRNSLILSYIQPMFPSLPVVVRIWVHTGLHVHGICFYFFLWCWLTRHPYSRKHVCTAPHAVKSGPRLGVEYFWVVACSCCGLPSRSPLQADPTERLAGCFLGCQGHCSQNSRDMLFLLWQVFSGPQISLHLFEKQGHLPEELFHMRLWANWITFQVTSLWSCFWEKFSGNVSLISFS